MSEGAKTEQQEGGQFRESLGRIWEEVKQISRQLERETRRSGRRARLGLDIRQLRREHREVCTRLGRAVDAARRDEGENIPLHEVEGFAGAVAALDALHDKIDAKEREIESLRQRATGSGEPIGPSEEVA